MADIPPPKKPRGFALMTPERRREIAAMGGKTAHEAGNAHRFTPKDAAKHGRKGAAARWHGETKKAE